MKLRDIGHMTGYIGAHGYDLRMLASNRTLFDLVYFLLLTTLDLAILYHVRKDKIGDEDYRMQIKQLEEMGLKSSGFKRQMT